MRVSVRYQGHVQGVGFRATARQLARDLPVTGWVRNEPDGSVTLQVQGDPAAVEQLLGRVQSTMDRFIQSAERTPLPDQRGEIGFVIAR